jgi:hypothetical protein
MHSFCDSHVEEDLHLFLNCDFSRYNGWACKILFLLLKRIWAQLKIEISFFNGGDYYNVQGIGTVRNDYIFRNEAFFVDGCGRRFSNFFAYEITCKLARQPVLSHG